MRWYQSESRSKAKRGLAKATIVVAAAATMAGVAAGSALAGEAHSTAATAGAERVVDYTGTIAPLNTILIPDLTCPASAPYLKNTVNSPGRGVPHGVEVIEPGGVGVTISSSSSGPDIEYWANGTLAGNAERGRFADATNWNPFASAHLTIRLHCSADKADGYK